MSRTIGRVLALVAAIAMLAAFAGIVGCQQKADPRIIENPPPKPPGGGQQTDD